MKKSYLVLENGALFEGLAPMEQQETSGEVVFTTGMTGYPESLTDPSYAGQILAFTYPLIGNYGVPPQEFWESQKIHAKGVIVATATKNWSHYAGIVSLEEWLKSQNVPLITGIDTRALTKMLRTVGTMRGAISNTPTFILPPSESLFVSKVSPKEKRVYGSGKKRIFAVDCGMKENLMRELMRFPVEIIRVPHDYDYTHEEFDGVFLSNGPGDPTECTSTIEILKKAYERKKAIFGVCLGSQLMALAAGGKTLKLKFGHRGHNQPVIDIKTMRCYITSQNHGYAVEEKSLPHDWEILFRNLNDGSVEGLAHRELPFFSVQFHPEAAPGPTDTRYLFERFIKCL